MRLKAIPMISLKVWQSQRTWPAQMKTRQYALSANSKYLNLKLSHITNIAKRCQMSQPPQMMKLENVSRSTHPYMRRHRPRKNNTHLVNSRISPRPHIFMVRSSSKRETAEVDQGEEMLLTLVERERTNPIKLHHHLNKQLTMPSRVLISQAA